MFSIPAKLKVYNPLKAFYIACERAHNIREKTPTIKQSLLASQFGDCREEEPLANNKMTSAEPAD